MSSSRKATFLITFALTAAAGCAVNRRYANEKIAALPHAKVELQYTFQDGAVATVAATGDTASSNPASDSPRRVLLVEYPHTNPRFGQNYAEVTVRNVEAPPDSKAEQVAKQVKNAPLKQIGYPDPDLQPTDGKMLRLALRREEFEHLMRSLVADGFFDYGEREGGVSIHVTLDNRKVDKSWDHVPALDQLVARVESETRQMVKGGDRPPKAPPAPAELHAPEPASDADARQLSAQSAYDPVKF